MPPRLHNSRQRFILILVALGILLFSLYSIIQQVLPVAAYQQSASPDFIVMPTVLSNCWTCSVTLTNNTKGKLSWKASSSGVSGITFNPASGSLAGKKSVAITIKIPKVPCPARATLLFNNASASWSCPAPPPTATPSPKPTATNTPSPTPTIGPGTPTPTPTPTTRPGLALTPTSTSSSGPVPIGSSGPIHPGTATAKARQTPTTSTNLSGGGPPSNGGDSGGSSMGIVFAYGALALAMLAFLLYLIPQSQSSLLVRLLSLVLPASFARRFGSR